MTAPADQDRIEPPVAGSEVATLLGSMERQRATFAWKAADLDAAGLATTVGASSLTLGGLLKHLAWVEELKFSTVLHGRPPAAPWDAVDWDADPEWPWRSAADDSPEHSYRLWHDAVVKARAAIAEALADGGLDRRVAWMPDDVPEHPSLRRLLADVLEEYARHTGHADLIREAVDGRVGEDAPGAVFPFPPLA